MSRSLKQRTVKFLLVAVGVLAISATNARAGFDNDVLVTDLFGGKVYAFDPQTGAGLGSFGGSPFLTNARGIAIDSSGFIYVGDLPSASVQKYDAFGNHVGAFVTSATSGGLAQPYAMVFDTAGNLLVSSAQTGVNSIFEYNASGALVKSFGAADGLSTPTGMAFGPDGNLYVVSSGNNEVIEFNGVTGAFIKVFSTGVNMGSGIAFGGGFLYVADGSSGSHSFYKIDATTGAIVNTFSDASLNVPGGIVVGKDNNIYIASLGTSSVLEFSPTGALIGTFASDPNLGGPISILGTPGVAVPEPAGVVLMALGSCGLLVACRTRLGRS